MTLIEPLVLNNIAWKHLTVCKEMIKSKLDYLNSIEIIEII